MKELFHPLIVVKIAQTALVLVFQNHGKSLPDRRMVGEHKVLVLWMLLEVERNYSYLHIAQKWLTFWQIPGWQVTLDLSLLDGLFTLLSKLLQMQNTFFLKCLFWVQYQIFQVRTILLKFQQKKKLFFKNGLCQNITLTRNN